METDGRLPTGHGVREAIETVDAETAAAPVYYMLNCAHPTHFETVLEPGDWSARIRGLRANASQRSHAELDEATTLDDGDPAARGAAYAELRRRLPHLCVLGGCCGTDHRHVEAIAAACEELNAAPHRSGLAEKVLLVATGTGTVALITFLMMCLNNALQYRSLV